MYARIYPYRNKTSAECPQHVQLILAVNGWCAPWHALREIAKDIPRDRLKGMELELG
jgi:hypothetical protein